MLFQGWGGGAYSSPTPLAGFLNCWHSLNKKLMCPIHHWIWHCNRYLTFVHRNFSEVRAIASAITVCQMAVYLKLARVCMRSLVNRIPQYKK